LKHGSICGQRESFRRFVECLGTGEDVGRAGGGEV
jgi:hypothetical protein